MGKRILLATPRFAPEKPAFAPWGGNRYTQPEGGAFFREEAGKHLKTESPSPFSEDTLSTGPKAFPHPGVRVS